MSRDRDAVQTDGHGFVILSDDDVRRIADAVSDALDERVVPIDRESWLALTDAERIALIGLCCRHCGTTKLPCYRGPEYDE